MIGLFHNIGYLGGKKKCREWMLAKKAWRGFVFVYTTMAYLLHGHRVDVEMGAESVERITHLFFEDVPCLERRFSKMGRGFWIRNATRDEEQVTWIG